MDLLFELKINKISTFLLDNLRTKAHWEDGILKNEEEIDPYI